MRSSEHVEGMVSAAPPSLAPRGRFASLCLPPRERKAARRGKQGMRDKEQVKKEARAGKQIGWFLQGRESVHNELVCGQAVGRECETISRDSRKLKPPGHSPSTELES